MKRGLSRVLWLGLAWIAVQAAMAQAAPLPGDVNADGNVDVEDLLYLVDSFGKEPGDSGYDIRCDFNDDGLVDVVDLLILVDNWGMSNRGVAIDATSLAVTEGGPARTYGIVLNSLPAADVMVSVVPASAELDVGAGPGAAMVLTFTPADWKTPQVVSVTAPRDYRVQGASRGVAVHHATASSDPDYDNLPVADVAVTIADVDVGPLLSFTSPVGAIQAAPGDSLPIAWGYFSAGRPASVTIFYSSGWNYTAGTTILQKQVPAGSGTDSLAWTVPPLPTGTYYIGATIDDGLNPPVIVYSACAVGISPSYLELALVEPAAPVNVLPGENLVIRWTQSSTIGNSTVALFYDSDLNFSNGTAGPIATLVESPTSTGGTYIWPVPSLPAGTYYLGAALNDGVHPQVVAYAAGAVTVLPASLTFTLTEPSGPRSILPGENMVIQWTQGGTSTSSTATLFLDNDTTYSNGSATAIAAVSQPAYSTGGTYVWNVPAVPAGTYYIGATLTDGIHSPVAAYASATIDISGLSVQVFGPSTNIQWHCGGSVAIQYQVNSPYGGTVRVFYDRDGVAGSGDEVRLPYTANVVTQPVTWTWTSAALPPGSYHIGVEVDDSLNDPVVGYAPGLVQELGPAVLVSAPASDVTWVNGGRSVDVTYVAYASSGTAAIFYDLDGIAASQDEVIVGSYPVQSGTAATQTWTAATLSYGTYHVGVKVSDGATTVWGYAPGRVHLTARSEYSLSEVGTAFHGCVFEGFSFDGRLGTVMAGRFDMLSAVQAAPDGISDFVLVAPLGDSHYAEDPEVGEAYLIPGWNSQTGARAAGWYEGAHYSVNAVGSDPNMPGTIIVGPAYISQTAGIAAVQPIADVDGDNGAELMIGMPLLINGRFEDQDYDPCDCDPPVAYRTAPFADPTTTINPPLPGVDPDDADWYAGLNGQGAVHRSGYITVLASTTPNLFNPISNLGGIVHIDKIGETLDPSQPVEDRDRRGREIDPALGVRVYPYARLVAAYDFMNNDYRFGQALGTEDVDGDGAPDWLIAEPKATNGAGDIAIGYSALATLWTGALPGTASSYSWPYMLPSGGCPGCDRSPRWPFGLVDYIRGDELKAPGGEMSNPIGVGDFNLDGIGDVGCAAPNYSAGGLQPQCGSAYIVFGRAAFGDHSVAEIKDPVTLNALPGIWIEGTVAGDLVGTTMTALGRPNWGMPGAPRLRDFNADGMMEWVIGAPGRDIPGKNDAGAIAIVWGNSRLEGHFTWDQITTGDLPGIIITGANQGDRFGEYMVEAGDINGDGSDDLLVAAPGAENPLTGAQDAGAIYIIYGPPSSGPQLDAYQALSGTCTIAELMQNGPVKVRVFYGASQGHQIGPVAGAGDIDNDGYEDILIADPAAAPLGRTGAGEVTLIFGERY